MDLRQLAYAVQIYHDKNFSRAAEKLHIAQPSLSQQLAKLEKELGVTLFHRTTNAVEPTHAGELFVQKAQRILDLARQLENEMNDISNLRKGKLVVGTLPITGSHILPIVLPEFARRHPGIEISLVEDTSANLEQLTSSGAVDLSLLSLPIEEPTLDYRPYATEEIRLAVPATHALAGAEEPVPVASLAEEAFVVLKKGQGFRQIAQDICAEAGFSPRIVFESSNIETVMSLVAAGMGVAFVPSMVAASKKGRYVPVFKSLVDPSPSRTLVIAERRGRYFTKAAEAFIETLMEVTPGATGVRP
ncbi:LysR family transcriptional regulator [Paenibacillus sp.]|uniref:LysR family transcriptional regulator n=1 Tax=Paenibacillus sp. TaxID=58172 RepID=UPI002D46B68C|nr:LysR family transcriptional regulator [Paenibacillus sp.]HZG56167.1 LysR family transcriptional regulator [Paenibacillus sp.]